MIEWPIEEFAFGNPDLGTYPHLQAYQAWVGSLLRTGYHHSDQVIRFTNGFLVDPRGAALCILLEPRDVRPVLANPETEFFMSGWNSPFVLCEDQRSLNLSVPFMKPSPLYLQTLKAKKRWKFNDSLSKEVKASIEHAQLDEEFMDFFRAEMVKKGNADIQHLVEGVLAYLLRLPPALLHVFKIRHKGELCGVACIVVVDQEKGLLYTIIFNSCLPVVYQFALFLNETLSWARAIHFGPLYSFISKDRYVYKGNICNSELSTPNVAITDNVAGLTPPYYHLSARRWVHSD